MVHSAMHVVYACAYALFAFMAVIGVLLVVVVVCAFLTQVTFRGLRALFSRIGRTL